MRLLTRNMIAAFVCATLPACGSATVPPGSGNAASGGIVPSSDAQPASEIAPDVVFRRKGDVTLGAPRAVAVDFGGIAFIADASPGRLVAYDPARSRVIEFQQPNTPGFYPTDIGVRGFFVYAIDESRRTLLRFDNTGAFRDVLLNFEQLTDGRRVSPHGLAVQETGRIAVTDVENHQVLVINNYLQLEVAFGNYGSFTGQFDSPRGVSFTPRGNLLVTDTGNRRLQVFTDGGTFLRQIPPEGVASAMQRPLRAVAADDGRVYVADPMAGRVFVFSPGGMPSGSFVPSGAQRFEPTDVELTSDGRLLVTDAATQSLYVFKGM